MNRFLWPLGIFIVLAGFLGVGLSLNPREIPSPMIGKPAPHFSLPVLGSRENFSPQDLRGEYWLMNVWASWCAACQDEHPVLVDIAKKINIKLIGVNYKEIRGDARFNIKKIDPSAEKTMAEELANAWLNRYGNPYTLSVLDLNGRVGIDYGVYGVPETYLIDEAGIIRYKHIGAITPALFSEKILPLIKPSKP